jgi:hypothetical protein
MTSAGRVRLQWRRWRAGLIIGLIVLLGGVGIAVLHSQPQNQYLNPGAVTADGTHALADVLTGLGHQVITATSVPAAVQAATPGSTLVITSPQYLASAELRTLSRVRASVLLVQPDAAALAAIASQVSLIGPVQPVVLTEPACSLRAATLAGAADMGGENLLAGGQSPPDAQCYTSTSGPTLVQLRVRGRTVTVLGAAAPLTNSQLARDGNAALVINLLPSRRIIWLVPAVAAVAGPAARGPRTFASLLPPAVYLVTIQLAIAVLLTAAWRARRLGQLVAEPLPVVVRAAETTEGHGRLYQSRHARAQAAGAIRSALLSRLERVVGLPAGAGQEAVVAALAQRLVTDHGGRSPARLSELLYGPAPRTDQALVALARDLDELEREVGMT